MTRTQPEKVVAVCLQAQHVAGLPASAEGRQILLHLLQHQQPHQQQQVVGEEAAAAARCRGGVAAFQDQVLLLHCAPVNSITSVVAVAVAVTVSSPTHDHGHYTTASVSDDAHHSQQQQHLTTGAVRVDLAEQLHRPSPSILNLVLGGAAAGAILSLTLHHRIIRGPHRRRSACLPLVALPDLLLNCLRPAAPNEEDNDDESSSGFITIEKGTISRRHPPSDNLLTTDDEGQGDGKPKSCCPMALAEELEVEDEFLAMLELEAHHHRNYNGDNSSRTLRQSFPPAVDNLLGRQL